MTPCVVCDIDGTLANNQHRKHWLLNKPKNWKAWYAGLMDDEPHWDIVTVVLRLISTGDPLIIATGREGSWKEKTGLWVQEKTPLRPTKIYSRAVSDHRDDTIVKVEILQQMRADGFEPWVWLDDRQRVVDALREVGVRVLQVQAGDF